MKAIAGKVGMQLPGWHQGQHLVDSELKEINIICAHRGWWKSSYMINKAVMHLLTGRNLGWYAPTTKPIEDNWTLLKRVVEDIPGSGDWFNESKKSFTIPGKGTAFFYSLEIEDNARGPSYSLVLGEEAGMWSETAFESVVEPIAAKAEGQVILAGTPNPANPNNFFYNLIHTAKDNPESMASWIIPALGADVVNDKLVVGIDPMTRYCNPGAPFRSVEKMQAKYAMSQRKRRWEIEYLCKFHSDEGGQFENVDSVCTIRPIEFPINSGNWFAEGYEREERRRNGWYQTGIDLAMIKDYLVICVMDCRTNKQCYFRRFRTGSMAEWDRVYEAIIHVRALFSGICNVDVTKDRSMETELPRRGCDITPITFTPKNKPVMLDNLSSLIATNKVTLFYETALIYELKKMQRKQMANHMQIAAPSGTHDDIPIALALMCMDVRPLGDVISVESNIDWMLNMPQVSEWHNPLW